MLGFLAQLLHAALILAGAPVLVGLIRRGAARLAGHAGPPLLQPWRDLARLARKQPVVAEGASRLFLAAPAIAFAASLAGAALVPSFTLGMTTAPIADLLLIVGLFALARATLALAAMDTGTAAGGISASRAMALGAFAESALLPVILVFVQIAGSSNLDTIARLLRNEPRLWGPALGLALVATGIAALAENGRLPADGRLREGAFAEYSGRHLALVQWGAALRLLAWLGLIAVLFAPFGIADGRATPLAWLLGLLLWILKIGVLAVALAVAETASIRMRLLRVVQLLGAALLFALLAALLLLARQGFV
jgi:formate hydrogenlyase subunit 4